MLKEFIKRIIYPIVGLSIPNRFINIRKTLIFNYCAFGLKGIFKLPVFIYDNTNIYAVGIIKINCPWQRGLVTIGKLDYKSQGKTKFRNTGIIEIDGPVVIGGCSIIENYGTIKFGAYIRVGDGSTFLIRQGLVIGGQTRIGFHCFIMDSDDHYTIDVESKKVFQINKAISIGKYNWIASKTFIKKGTKTPDYIIVASANALLTKDYSDIPPYSILGGSPVKLLKVGTRRIYNKESEKLIYRFFLDNPSLNSFTPDLCSDKELDEFCTQTGLEF